MTAMNPAIPDARALLPPLLACLPTAFVSPHPPPALLPLLSPILRQRLTLLSGNTSSGNGGWLSLLSWDPARAKKLGKHLEGVQFEAHPVSGELEVEDVETIGYRRLDEETLQARMEVQEFSLLPIFVWVQNDDQNGGTGAGWKVAELRVLEDKDDGCVWSHSIPEADSVARGSAASSSATNVPVAQQPPPVSMQEEVHEDDNDDNDDYWALYDQTPGRTPARTPAKRSPVPQQRSFAASNLSSSNVQVGPTAEELEYFARYASEVQPALDSHDPDEENELSGESTLQGDEFTRAVNPTRDPLYEADDAKRRDPAAGFGDADIEAPRATSPSSQGSVERLERLALQQQQDGHDGAETRAEVGVRQFISTEMKSLFRLARSVGMDRSDFREVINRELDVLGFMEGDD